MATEKIVRNNPAVTKGARIVWVQTFKNRATSRWVNVYMPNQFTRPKRRTPISIVLPFMICSSHGLIAMWSLYPLTP